MLKIKVLSNDFANKALEIYQKCAAYHAEKGFYQWDKTYPNMEIILSDIEKGWLFGGFENDFLISLIAITEDEPEEYHNLNWSSKAPYKIIHRLCVDTKHLRKGYAKEMMKFTENYCSNNQIHSIRLDTYTPNSGARKFYAKLGYSKIGEINFPKRKEHTYTCFEKIL